MIDRLSVAGPPSAVRTRINDRLKARDCDTLILHTPSLLMSDPAARASGDPGLTYREHVNRLIDAFSRRG